MTTLSPLSDRDVAALECASCREAIGFAKLAATVERVGACGLSTEGEDPDYLVFAAVPSVRTRIRVLAWHQDRHDWALIEALLERVRRCSIVEVRGCYHGRVCGAVPAQTLQHWGFLPLGPAEDAWWRLDLGPTVRLRRWVRQQWDGLNMPAGSLPDPVTPRNR